MTTYAGDLRARFLRIGVAGYTRAVVTGLDELARASLPVRVHQPLDEAVTALSRDLEWARADAQSIKSGLETLRSDRAQRGGTPVG